MKILIDIPDEVLESKSYCQYFDAWSDKLSVTIENGIPLPKGHGRLIDENDISLIILEDSLHLMKWEKGSEVNCVIEAPVVIEADT